jgi:hypothetical protein
LYLVAETGYSGWPSNGRRRIIVTSGECDL